MLSEQTLNPKPYTTKERPKSRTFSINMATQIKPFWTPLNSLLSQTAKPVSKTHFDAAEALAWESPKPQTLPLAWERTMLWWMEAARVAITRCRTVFRALDSRTSMVCGLYSSGFTSTLNPKPYKAETLNLEP